MTLELDMADPRGALYTVCKLYRGGIKALAMDLEMKEQTLYAKLRGASGYALSYGDGGEVDEILNLLRAHGVDIGAVVQAFAHRYGMLAVPMPDVSCPVGSQAAQQISRMMQEVANVAQEIADAVSVSGDGGSVITPREQRRIATECDKAMEIILAAKRWSEAQCKAFKGRGA